MQDYDYGLNWKELSDDCKRKYNYVCQRCHKSFKDDKFKLHAHHIIPLSKGGRNVLSNLIPLCEDCHSKTHGRVIKSRNVGNKNAKHTKR